MGVVSCCIDGLVVAHVGRRLLFGEDVVENGQFPDETVKIEDTQIHRPV